METKLVWFKKLEWFSFWFLNKCLFKGITWFLVIIILAFFLEIKISSYTALIVLLGEVMNIEHLLMYEPVSIFIDKFHDLYKPILDSLTFF